MRLSHPLRSQAERPTMSDHPSEPHDPEEETESQPLTDSHLRPRAFLEHAMSLWGDAVYRVALAQTGSPSDAEDVYQDVFLRLLKDTTPFTGDEHLKAWLLRVAINRCHDLARTSWKRRTGPLEHQHADIAAPDAFKADIWEVVGALPYDLRAAVHLFYVEGYSTEEIARIVHCKPSTVRSRLHRAREQLRAKLEQDETPDIATTRKEPPDAREQRNAEPERLPFDDVRPACARSAAR